MNAFFEGGGKDEQFRWCDPQRQDSWGSQDASAGHSAYVRDVWRDDPGADPCQYVF